MLRTMPLFPSPSTHFMADVWRRTWLLSKYRWEVPLPENEMICRKLAWEWKKNLKQERLMARMLKAIEVIFTCVSPSMRFHRSH